ncbi:hypothetical protein LZ554_000097 [Drepanopeziza brunnea f. sp. 'monogermtubi']|nr:hypothetical protein LZ554_000097 [Drepanopeziza brunnea f. sp. 'monogermtubi']
MILGSVSESSAASPVEPFEALAMEQPKLKGRAKFLRGLQRISSSPSLAQFGRRRTESSPYAGRDTLSCASLASGTPPRSHDSPYPTRSSGAGFSTAPTTPCQGLGQSSFTPSTSIMPMSASPLNLRSQSSQGATNVVIPEIFDDYFSLPVPAQTPKRRANFNFWREMPPELRLAVFAFLRPKELVRASVVSKLFHETCFDGQLWTCFDASECCKTIPAESLAKIIVTAGPFVKDINLRGCVQVEHYKRAEVVVKACRNLISANLEGCKNFQRSTLHNLLKNNERLASLTLTGLPAVTNSTCKIIAKSCPSLEMFNVSWCTHMDARGVQTVINGCPKLKDLRAGELRGFHNLEVAQDIFDTNNLERLVLSGCSDITDEALQIILHGKEPDLDILTDIPIVPIRKLRHLDLSRCSRLTNAGIRTLAHLVPALEGLQLSGCMALTDNALTNVLATIPKLTHLDLEELSELTNSFLSEHLAKAPCAPSLEHLSISYCENIGDTGMLPVIRACTSLRRVDMDNTKISDLVLAEAASMVCARSLRATGAPSPPRVSLQMIVFDCSNVTWTGVREVISRNSEFRKRSGSRKGTYATELIGIKCFCGWQATVDEHMRRVLGGDIPAARRLEHKWASFMMTIAELGTDGGDSRRRRRRAREAQMMHADEEEGGFGMGGIGRRRRARSNGCAMM